MKQKNLTLHITVSANAYRNLRNLTENHKESEIIRMIIEACSYYKGNLYELLAHIGAAPPNLKKK